MIERFCHLKIELERFKIVKTREEIIDKVIKALPRADQWQTFVFILKNDALYDDITLDVLLEKIESHDLELQKQSKMSSSSHHQNVGLYYKGNLPSVKADSSPKTAFSGEKMKETQTTSSSYNSGYHSSSKASSEESEEILCNIALKLKNSPAMSINAAKQQMSFLASVLESYEGLGNSELAKEDYDQIDPEEMELIDIRWCLASCIRRAQRCMEITGKQSLGGSSTKLGFDKSKVTCFKCKQKGHFKRECTNSAAGGNERPFNDEYYRKSIYHRSKEEPKMIEDKPKSRACVVFHDDEGYDWSDILPEEDRVDYRFKIRTKEDSEIPLKKHDHYAFVAKIKEENQEEKGTIETKEKTREEILKEKTERERFIVGCRMEKMQEEYENAVRNKRWDKKQECFVNKQGEPVVPRSDIIHDDVLLVIPRSGEYYSNVAKDKTYVKRLDKIIRDAMTTKLRKRNEERMKKNIENLVDNLKKDAEEVKVEEVEKVEDVKMTEKEEVIKEKVVEKEKAVTEEQQFVDVEKKIESSTEVKNENLKFVSDARFGEEEKQNDADQNQTEVAANTKVPITEVKSDSEVLNETVEQ
ncbi:putative transcription factor interactor and regulator CCHC(Zn) family [Helianthus annuus]|nr:putative transcription factor interactor and regulator CCHC(Zn) family [Helianthus annuus]